MDWYKTHHGLPYDPRFAAIAKRANTGRALVVAAWLCLLDSASQANPRGSLQNFDPEQAAAALDCGRDAIDALVALFTEKKMIEAAAIADWHHRQAKSTDRVRAHRQRRQQETGARA